MPEIGTSGSMSGDEKRSDATWPQRPRSSSTLLVECNAGLPPERRIEFRVGIHLGDVVEASDGDLMGDGVNIAAR